MTAKIPYFKQTTNYSCAAAVFKMILAARGIKASQVNLTKFLKSKNPRGTHTKELVKLARKFKLKLKTKSNSSISELKTLQKNHLIVLLDYIKPKRNTKIADDHFTLLKKIDKNHIYLLDPYFGKNKKFKISEFNKIWHSDPRFEKKKKWFLALKSS